MINYLGEAWEVDFCEFPYLHLIEISPLGEEERKKVHYTKCTPISLEERNYKWEYLYTDQFQPRTNVFLTPEEAFDYSWSYGDKCKGETVTPCKVIQTPYEYRITSGNTDAALSGIYNFREGKETLFGVIQNASRQIGYFWDDSSIVSQLTPFEEERTTGIKNAEAERLREDRRRELESKRYTLKREYEEIVTPVVHSNTSTTNGWHCSLPQSIVDGRIVWKSLEKVIKMDADYSTDYSEVKQFLFSDVTLNAEIAKLTEGQTYNLYYQLFPIESWENVVIGVEVRVRLFLDSYRNQDNYSPQLFNLSENLADKVYRHTSVTISYPVEKVREQLERQRAFYKKILDENLSKVK